MSVRICCVKPVVEFLLYGIAVVGEFKGTQLEDLTPGKIEMQVESECAAKVWWR